MSDQEDDRPQRSSRGKLKDNGGGTVDDNDEENKFEEPEAGPTSSKKPTQTPNSKQKKKKNRHRDNEDEEKEDLHTRKSGQEGRSSSNPGRTSTGENNSLESGDKTTPTGEDIGNGEGEDEGGDGEEGTALGAGLRQGGFRNRKPLPRPKMRHRTRRDDTAETGLMMGEEEDRRTSSHAGEAGQRASTKSNRRGSTRGSIGAHADLSEEDEDNDEFNEEEMVIRKEKEMHRRMMRRASVQPRRPSVHNAKGYFNTEAMLLRKACEAPLTDNTPSGKLFFKMAKVVGAENILPPPVIWTSEADKKQWLKSDSNALLYFWYKSPKIRSKIQSELDRGCCYLNCTAPDGRCTLGSCWQCMKWPLMLSIPVCWPCACCRVCDQPSHRVTKLLGPGEFGFGSKIYWRSQPLWEEYFPEGAIQDSGMGSGTVNNVFFGKMYQDIFVSPIRNAGFTFNSWFEKGCIGTTCCDHLELSRHQHLHHTWSAQRWGPAAGSLEATTILTTLSQPYLDYHRACTRDVLHPNSSLENFAPLDMEADFSAKEKTGVSGWFGVREQVSNAYEEEVPFASLNLNDLNYIVTAHNRKWGGVRPIDPELLNLDYIFNKQEKEANYDEGRGSIGSVSDKGRDSNKGSDKRSDKGSEADEESAGDGNQGGDESEKEQQSEQEARKSLTESKGRKSHGDQNARRKSDSEQMTRRSHSGKDKDGKRSSMDQVMLEMQPQEEIEQEEETKHEEQQKLQQDKGNAKSMEDKGIAKPKEGKGKETKYAELEEESEPEPEPEPEPNAEQNGSQEDGKRKEAQAKKEAEEGEVGTNVVENESQKEENENKAEEAKEEEENGRGQSQTKKVQVIATNNRKNKKNKKKQKQEGKKRQEKEPEVEIQLDVIEDDDNDEFAEAEDQNQGQDEDKSEETAQKPDEDHEVDRSEEVDQNEVRSPTLSPEQFAEAESE